MISLRITFAFLLALSTSVAFAQAGDTTIFKRTFKSTSIVNPEKQVHYIVRNNVALATSKILLTVTEDQVLDHEGAECNALLKRDTAMLIELWQRDFTLEDEAKKLVQNKDALPYYVSLGRVIEKLTVSGNVVFTSGNETYREILSDGRLAEPVKRNFFHAWTNQNGKWKLTTRSHN